MLSDKVLLVFFVAIIVFITYFGNGVNQHPASERHNDSFQIK